MCCSVVSWFRVLLAGFIAAFLIMVSPNSFAQRYDTYEDSREITPGHRPAGPNRNILKDDRQVYLFYPQHNLYYDVQEEQYIYFTKGRWQIYNQNPLRVSLGPSFTLRMHSDKPYKNNAEHRKKYKHVP